MWGVEVLFYFIEDASVALVYLGPFAVGVDWGAWFADFTLF